MSKTAARSWKHIFVPLLTLTLTFLFTLTVSAGSRIYGNLADAAAYFRGQADHWPREITVRISAGAFPEYVTTDWGAWHEFRYEFVMRDEKSGPHEMLWHYGITGTSGNEYISCGSTELKHDGSGSYYELVYRSSISREEANAIDEAAMQVIDSLGIREATDFEKIKAVYDWLREEVVYGGGETEYIDQTAYSALVNHRAICAGYSLAFCRIMEFLGIDAHYISGQGRPEATLGHVWNIVRLNGQYYNLDATWDAELDRYRYFLTNEETFSCGGTYHVRDAIFQRDAFMQKYPMSPDNYLRDGEGGFGYAVFGDRFSSFSAWARDSVVHLNWSAVEGVSDYYVDFFDTNSGSWKTFGLNRLQTFQFASSDGQPCTLRIRTGTGILSQELTITPDAEQTVSEGTVYPSVPFITFCRNAGPGCVSLRWVGSDEAEKYTVYTMNYDGSFQAFYESERPETVITGLPSGETCYFWICAHSQVLTTFPECRSAHAVIE